MKTSDTAFVVDSHLKHVSKLEEDYLALTKHTPPTLKQPKRILITSNIVKQIILPKLENEVNQGKNFANLRQIFYSLILAKWYKQALRQALLNQVCTVTGIR